ncbi:hypothetical protein BSKO_12182 [Bryopsis sp. KO-2023]|nr:hypothetical protein BSKO_12182 [Bryopsis sp. KO-2023]
MVFPTRRRNGLVLKPKKSSFDTLGGNLSGRRSLSFNLEVVGRNGPISAPKVVEDVVPPRNSANISQSRELNRNRFRFPHLPKLRLPFLNRGKKSNPEGSLASHSDTEMGYPSTPSSPFNPDLHDSSYSVQVEDCIGFTQESYTVVDVQQTEVALADMARSLAHQTANHPPADGNISPEWSGSSWGFNNILPEVKDDGGMRSSASSYVRDREWVSSPDQEIENTWKLSEEEEQSRRRPSSAYGYVERPPPRRTGLDGGSRPPPVKSELPVSFSAIGSPASDGSGQGSSVGQIPPVPKLSLDGLVRCNRISQSDRPGHRGSCNEGNGFGSEIPLLDDAASVDLAPEPARGSSSSSSCKVPLFFTQPLSLATSPFAEDDRINDLNLDAEGDYDDRYYIDDDEESSDEGDMDESHDGECITVVTRSVSDSNFDGLADYYDEEEEEEEMTDPSEPVYDSDSHVYHRSKHYYDDSPRSLSSTGVSTEDQPRRSSPYLRSKSMGMLNVPDSILNDEHIEGAAVGNVGLLPHLSECIDDYDLDGDYPTTIVSDETPRSHAERELEEYDEWMDDAPVKTVLDALEERAALKRKECSYRIACQRAFVRSLKDKVHKSKIAFKRLKQGLGPQLTDKVAKMRQKFGGKLRGRRQERRERMIQKDEEDLWDLHFDAESNAAKCYDSDGESWVTDDDLAVEA